VNLNILTNLISRATEIMDAFTFQVAYFAECPIPCNQRH